VAFLRPGAAFEVAKTNPGALRYIVMLMALYMHLGPFSKRVISEIDRRIAELHHKPSVITPQATRDARHEIAAS